MSKIEWVKCPDGTQGITVNPVTGECPVGCSYCYVEPMRKRFGWDRAKEFHKERLDAIYKLKKPTGIFIGSIIELFHDTTIGVMPLIIETIRRYPQHRFYLVTKCPQNLYKFNPFPDNCFVIASATNVGQYRDARHGLGETEAKNKGISFEPLLEHISVSMIGLKHSAGVNLVIIGQQTPVKLHTTPKIEWVSEIVSACDKAGIPVFLKNNLLPLIETSPYSSVFYSDQGMTLRQEMPKC